MCVIIVCTVASRCTRRYGHDREEQRAESVRWIVSMIAPWSCA